VGLGARRQCRTVRVLILRDREMGGASVEEIVRRATKRWLSISACASAFVWPDDDFRSSHAETARKCDRDVVEAGIGGACERQRSARVFVRTRPLAEIADANHGRTARI